MVTNDYTQSDTDLQFVQVAEPERLAVCEVCGSGHQVQLTADPDRGGLQLCADCRRLFGFESGGQYAEIAY